MEKQINEHVNQFKYKEAKGHQILGSWAPVSKDLIVLEVLYLNLDQS